jgi:hypothetical protein
MSKFKFRSPLWLIIPLFVMSSYSNALDGHYFSLKVSDYQPYIDGDNFFDGSIEFDSSMLNELTYTAPSYKEFSFSISAVLDVDSSSVEEIKGMLDFGGITTVVTKGNIKGGFKESGEFVFPGNEDPDELFQALLPSDPDFEGEYIFYGIGFESSEAGVVKGIGYLSQTMPALIDIDTNQEYTFGRNPRTGEFENYHPEGTLPYRAVDAEGQFELMGLWVQYDTLREAFENAEGRDYTDLGWLFTVDTITGFGFYTPGKRVEDDYFNATGKTLFVDSSTSYLTSYISYEGGGQFIMAKPGYILAFAAGIEGSLKVDLFDSDANYKSSDAQGSLFTESTAFSYSIFARIAASF